jgi:hypothetical protein
MQREYRREDRRVAFPAVAYLAITRGRGWSLQIMVDHLPGSIEMSSRPRSGAVTVAAGRGFYVIGQPQIDRRLHDEYQCHRQTHRGASGLHARGLAGTGTSTTTLLRSVAVRAATPATKRHHLAGGRGTYSRLLPSWYGQQCRV